MRTFLGCFLRDFLAGPHKLQRSVEGFKLGSKVGFRIGFRIGFRSGLG